MSNPLDIHVWTTVPQDGCPFAGNKETHPGWHAESVFGVGIPVAVSGIEENRARTLVRYVCPSCRAVWDTTWNCSTNEMGQQFGDRFVIYTERFKSPVRGGVSFPAGPSDIFQSA